MRKWAIDKVISDREKAVKEISRMRYWMLAWGGGRDSWTEHGEGRPPKEVIHLLKARR